MVELLVVIIVISILASAVLIASSAVLDRFRVTNTKAVLQVVSDAVEEFKREQTANPSIVRANRHLNDDPAKKKYFYRDRYGDYPPDELEVFTRRGVPGWGNPAGNNNWSLASGKTGSGANVQKSQIVPAPTSAVGYSEMRYYWDADIYKNSIESRDQQAMIVAIETLGDVSASMLAKIPERNRTTGVLEASGDPALFLDRLGGAGCDAEKWDSCDLQIRPIVDDWGVPIGYFSSRDWTSNLNPAAAMELESTNHTNWHEASSAFVKANRGVPLVMSYGPDGKDQLTKDIMAPTTAAGPSASPTTAAASLVGDYAGPTPARTIDHPMNADNIYLDPSLTVKFAEGL